MDDDFKAFDRLGGLVVVLEETGVIAHANEACRELSGRALEHLVGASFAELAGLGPEEATRALDRARAIDEHGPRAFATAWPGAEGGRREIVWSARMADAEGAGRIVLAGVDATGLLAPSPAPTAATAANPVEAPLSAFLEAAPDALVMVDADGVIALANGLAERLFGWRRDELVGRRIEVLVPRSAQSRHAQRRSAFAGAPVARSMGAGLDLRGLRKDGSEFACDISLGGLVHRGRMHVIAAVRDVTDRRREAEERERLLAELQATVAEVKRLSGLLPICAWCKKIRDDQGYWHALEIYISERSEAQFTHAICTSCAANLSNRP